MLNLFCSSRNKHYSLAGLTIFVVSWSPNIPSLDRSTNPNCLMKFWCFCHGRALVSPSAGIWLVGIQVTLIFSLATCSQSQWQWMSTCLSLVIRVRKSLTSSWIVCWLLQLIIMSCPRLNQRSSKRQFHQRASVAVCNRASSSASVVDIETIFCLIELQLMGLPKSLKRYPLEL